MSRYTKFIIALVGAAAILAESYGLKADAWVPTTTAIVTALGVFVGENR